MSDDIDKLRREIDRLDGELLALLQRRAQLARRIGALKGAAAAYRPERESEILRRVAAQIGRASCRERVSLTCRSRWSPYH